MEYIPLQTAWNDIYIYKRTFSLSLRFLSLALSLSLTPFYFHSFSLFLK